jgi:hypothetical protein
MHQSLQQLLPFQHHTIHSLPIQVTLLFQQNTVADHSFLSFSTEADLPSSLPAQKQTIPSSLPEQKQTIPSSVQAQ